MLHLANCHNTIKFINIEVNFICDPFASFSICRINFVSVFPEQLFLNLMSDITD